MDSLQDDLKSQPIVPPSSDNNLNSQTNVTQEIKPQETENLTVVNNTPSIIEPPFIKNPKNKNGLRKFLTGFFMFFLLALIAGTAYGTYAVAYEKIKLDKYPEIQNKISMVVMSIPFMPKTPKYLLAKSAYVHQSISKESFDVSIAVDSKDLVSALGLSGLDLQAKGAVDYSDPKDIKITVNGSVTKDFNFELIKLDKTLYFKINKLPQLLLTAVGLKAEEFDSLLGKWVSYDTTPLETEARKSIEDKEVDPLSKQFVDDELQKYLDDNVLSKMKVENSNEDGFDIYKITLTADAELIDHLGKKLDSENNKDKKSTMNVLGANTDKLSDIVKSLTWEIYIDKKDFYTRKIIVKADMEGDSFDTGGLLLGNSTGLPKNANAKIAFAAKFSDFGKDLKEVKPSDSLTWEQFLNLGSEIMQKKYSGFNNGNSSYLSANDAKRMADLQNIRTGLELYKVDFNKYPNSLDSLKPKYLANIPKDPSGVTYYYKVSTNEKSYDLCGNLEAPRANSLKACPNPNYNVWLKNP